MRRLVSIDGRIVPPEAATIPVYDRGFLYGDAVFETLRTYDAVPCALEAHVARLLRSAGRLRISVPGGADAVRAQLLAAFAAAREGPTDDGYARIMLTRGAAPLGLDMDLAKAPSVIVLVEPIPPPPAYDAGIRAVTVATLRAADGTPAAGAKVTSYLASILALADAKAAGAQEAILLDARGRVVEGTTSNVFVVSGEGRIRTPGEEVGLLLGITRALVMQAAEVETATLVPEDLYGAAEVFVTSSVREVIGVVAVDGRPIGAGTPGPVTRRVHEAYRARARAAR
jgi:branched-chain amino acid aminotransferase